MNDMIHVIASIHVHDGHMAEFLDIFKANVANVLQEEGCLEYVPTIDFPTSLGPQEKNDQVVTIIEKWSSFDHLQAHMAAPHMLAYQQRVAGLVAGVSLKVLKGTAEGNVVD